MCTTQIKLSTDNIINTIKNYIIVPKNTEHRKFGINRNYRSVSCTCMQYIYPPQYLRVNLSRLRDKILKAILKAIDVRWAVEGDMLICNIYTTDKSIQLTFKLSGLYFAPKPRTILSNDPLLYRASLFLSLLHKILYFFFNKSAEGIT